MMTWYQLGLQDSNTPVMEEFIWFHDFTLVILLMIISLVGVLLGGSMVSQSQSTNLLDHQMVECVWTILPALVLIQVAIPSLLLLYTLEESLDSSLVLKAVGHQWYWSYEYSDFWSSGTNVEFDSYMGEGSVRLLDVDNRIALPAGLETRVLVGSGDVLHAWTVPSMGVKADACPGRLNQVSLTPLRPGVYYGQCSEICGANHSFMPISVEVGSAADFMSWLESQD